MRSENRSLLSSPLLLSLIALFVALSERAVAQVPNPQRHVHPSIADPAPAAVLHGPGPMLQYPDGKWNHGEGFAAVGSPDVDSGGWHFGDDGTNVTSADIHLTGTQTWAGHTVHFQTSPWGVAHVQRLQGYLRPATIALPLTHPRYGSLGLTAPDGFVDSGAFEVFRPVDAYSGTGSGQKILIVIMCFSTVQFPEVKTGPGALDYSQYIWPQTYRGYFSKDGLVRKEFANGGTGVAGFLANDQPDDVERSEPLAIGTWYLGPNQSVYYPICAYPVLSVPGRQTELNDQRYLQLTQAIKCLLQEDASRNPIWTGSGTQLSAEEVEENVVVVFIGGSNGGQQSSWAALTQPHIVHGCAAGVINPSIQRLFGEHDLGWAVAELSGSNGVGAAITPGEFLDWGQYAWNRGLQVHDMSYTRHFASGTAYRPTLFFVGDEDLTSTGTDWIRLVAGGSWLRSGMHLRPAALQPWPSQFDTFAWMVAENTCHEVGLVVDPYLGGSLTPYIGSIEEKFFTHAVEHRSDQLRANASVPTPAIAHTPRIGAALQLRGLDDPHEHFFGRGAEGPAVPSPGDPLVRDDAFVDATQPGAAGTWLGNKEAMLIRDNRLYVGSADGLVSSFIVDTIGPREPLVRVAQSKRLGHRAFALAALDAGGGGWSLLVGTRRNLYKLDPVSLTVQDQADLPWECAQPHRLKVADVLQGHNGSEVIFASVHGGLVFYDTNLTPIHEWSEPGIVDYVVQAGGVSILSRRGVVANVTFDPANKAWLQAASQPLPLVPGDPPSQGMPQDLELVKLNFGGAVDMLVGLWTSDADEVAIRAFDPTSLVRYYVPQLTNLAGLLSVSGGGRMDLATCKENLAVPVGDHLLLLLDDNLLLFNQYAQLQGKKSLIRFQGSSGAEYFPFGRGSIALAVGELLPGPAGGYQEEVVVATEGGHLLWMHVQDIVGPGDVLPSSYAVANLRGGAAFPHIQPRTNQALSATWAMARKPGDNLLHVLDQQGSYWRVDGGTATQPATMALWEREELAAEARGWSHLGPLVGPTPALRTSGYLFPQSLLFSPFVHGASVPHGSFANTKPWCPINSKVVVFEYGQYFVPNNWAQGLAGFGVFEDFFVHRLGGSLVPTPAGMESWYWSAGTQSWGNLVEGMSITTAGIVDGLWASTGVLDPGTMKTPYHDLRHLETQNPAMAHQALVAVKLYGGQTAVVLGCPGGRVRVMMPGAMRPDGTTQHELNLAATRSSADFGFGGAALAVRNEGTAAGEQLRIWFGTHYAPTPQPAAYLSNGALGDTEVAAGSVHQMTWNPGSGLSSSIASVTFHPSPAHPRGAYDVVGLLLTDLIPSVSGPPRDELIVGTLSGDLIVLDAAAMTEIWRTNVPGAVGFYNSMLAEDLDNDGLKELYVAGSRGLWRFVLPAEHNQ